MDKNTWKKEKLPELVGDIINTYADSKGINHIDGLNLPSKVAIHKILDMFFTIFFPGYIGGHPVTRASLRYYVGELIDEMYTTLSEEAEKAFHYQCRMDQCIKCDCEKMADDAVMELLEKIPEIRKTLKIDVAAAYDGDPAAKSFDEIILAYPCIEAITTHRIAHELYKSEAPLIPRMMSERAHNRTGIDIHPGAVIGKNFFIDHGTGVVIGETTIIGDNVKIYQGVTLGALSFPKDADGKLIRDRKRHPTIEESVVIYSNATVLGGETVVGRNSVIGASVSLNKSVPANTVVTIEKPSLRFREAS